jgi:ABC-type dipeptide/oligopeptide/nickel transport system permease subunit
MASGLQESDAHIGLPVSPAADAFRRLKRNPIAVVSGLYIVLLALTALFAPILAHNGSQTGNQESTGANAGRNGLVSRWDYDDLDVTYNSLPSPPDSKHRLGTDNLGQDVLSRLIYGARISLTVAVLVVFVEALIGVTLGLFAGYGGGIRDLLLMRVTDVMFAFPDILLALLVVAVLRSGERPLTPLVNTGGLVFALGIVAWPGLARLVRGQALTLREKEYVEAAKSAGVRERNIIWKHVLPNLLSPIIVSITQDAAGVILAEATLSFLGLGVPAPFPSWGRMIDDALPFKETQPLLLLAPSVLLALTVMAFNFFGDALRDALDPRLRD